MLFKRLSVNQLRFLLSSVALIFGAIIVLISLSAVNPVMSSEGYGPATQRRVYFGQTILPDHIAYPALMMVDRVELEVAPPHKRLELQVEYAMRRLEYTRELLTKDKSEMALTTLTKSQKYMLHAAQETLEYQQLAPSQEFEQTTQYMILVLQTYQQQVIEVSKEFSDNQKSVVDRLLAEIEALHHSLELSLQQ